MDYLEDANALIWMIDAERGTIPASDLDFLEELDLTDKKLYIVVNKADLKGVSACKNIIKGIQETLDDYDIDSAGISAYSSNDRREYANIKMSLYDFLLQQNKITNMRKNINDKLDSVIKMYKNAISKDIEYNEKMAADLNNLNQHLGLDVPDQFGVHLETLKNIFRTDELEKQKGKIKKIGENMSRAITNIFKNVK
jgi:protein-tyrosine-phosphatase